MFRLQQKNLFRIQNEYFCSCLMENHEYDRGKHFKQTNRNLSSTNIFCAKKKPGYEEHLPVFDYGSVNLENKRLYVFGSAICIGLPFLIKPTDENHKKMYALKPIRNEFAYYNPVFDIAAGHGFTLLATKQHANGPFYLFGCGVNKFSQLGFQAVRPSNPLEVLLSFSPIKLPISSTKPKILSMGAGLAHSLVSIKDEGLFSFGDNSKGQCGRFVIPDEDYFGSKLIHRVKLETSEDIVNICARFDISVCTTSGGQVYTFGHNHKGQLGRGKSVPGFWVPEQVKGDLEGQKVVGTASSGSSVLCVTEHGHLVGWGCNEWGQIDPYKSANTYYEPRFVKLPRKIGRIKSVAMGDVFTFVLNELGEVYVWGHGNSLGLGPDTKYAKFPTLIPPPLFGRNEFNMGTVVKAIYASCSYAAAINSIGDLFTWGENHSACLGLRNQPAIQPFPLKVCLGGAVHKVALGVDHTVVLSKGGF